MIEKALVVIKEHGPSFSFYKKKAGPGSLPKKINYKNSESGNRKSLIHVGSQIALTCACKDNRKAQAESLSENSNLGCILIESTRFSGYLVAAMAGDVVISDELLINIKNRLFQFLRDSGEVVQENENLYLKLKQVPFVRWASARAEFLNRASHEGQEVAVAFFPRADLRYLYEQCQDEASMAKIGIEQIVAEQPVEFNLYLKLSLNKRYILYTPRGGHVSQQQMERLKRGGLLDFHVQMKELSQVERYCAQNYLSNISSVAESNFLD